MGEKCRKYLHSFFMSLPCDALIFAKPVSTHWHCMNKNWTKGIENMVRIIVVQLGQVCLSLHQCSWILYLAKLCQLEIYNEFNPNLSRNTEITSRNSFTPWSKLWPSTVLSFTKLMLAWRFFFLWRASMRNIMKILKMVTDRWTPCRRLFYFAKN